MDLSKRQHEQFLSAMYENEETNVKLRKDVNDSYLRLNSELDSRLRK
jgi:hypothetical protein